MNSKQDDGNKRLTDDKGFERRLRRVSLITNLFRRYFSGEASEKEKQIIDTWDAGKAWEKHRKEIKQSHHEMDSAVDELWEKISNQLQFKKKRPSIPFNSRIFGRYAAIITAIVILSSVAFYLAQNTSIIQPNGLMAEINTHFETNDKMIKKIELPDGSHIMLNRGSKLSYQSKAFNKEIREVWLEGEAYFDVAKNPNKPFIVHSGELETVVKGTSFNIKAYAGISRNVISVQSGLVEVRNSDKVLNLLDKDKQIIYNNEDGHFVTEETVWEDCSGWMVGRLVLNHADLSELKLRVSQHYNAELIIRNNALEGIALKSSFAPRTPLKVVLESLKLLYGIQYTIINDHQIEIWQ